MAGAASNVTSVKRVLVGLGVNDICDKPKIADFLTCLVHHFSPNEKSTTINCKVQDDMLLLCSPNRGNKLSDENKGSTGAVNDKELGCVTLYVGSKFDGKPSGYKLFSRITCSHEPMPFFFSIHQNARCGDYINVTHL